MKNLRVSLLIFGLCLSAVLAAEPTITRISVPASGRMMDEVSLSCDASAPDDPRRILYEWSITSDPTGAARMQNPASRLARLELWWPSQATAANYVGLRVELRLRAFFEGATEADSAAERTASVMISGVNYAPVPVIDGALGTPTDRIPAGQSIQVNSFKSSDPDGDAFRPDWGLGNWRGGRYIRPPVMYGTEGAIAAFTVPDMTAPIDQEIVLHLSDGLHRVETKTKAYVRPADAVSPPPSSAPVLTVQQSTVSVIQGEIAEMAVIGNDADGDDLTFTWVFLQGGTTMGTGYITSRRTSTTSWVSSLSYPTASLAPGNYAFSVQAVEAGKSSPQSSTAASISLVVGTAGGGGGISEDRAVCGQNPSPSLVSISPDPRLGTIVLTEGQASNLVATFRDYSEASSALGGTRKGISEIAWNRTELSQIGISASAVFSGTADPYEGRSTLTLTAGQSAPRAARVQAVVTDVEGCKNTIAFDVSVEQPKSNQKPVPKLSYTDGAVSKSVPNGSTVEVTSRNLALDAGATTDDGGSANLNYSWLVVGQATLSNLSGTKTSLSIHENATGPVTLTLSAKDSGGLSASMTVAFKVVSQSEAPVARIGYDTGESNWIELANGSTAQVPTADVQLDGGSSTDDGGVEGLAFSWAVAGQAALSATSGQKTTLSIAEGNTGIVTVTLTVRDQGGQSGSATVAFKRAPANAAPVAAVKFDSEGQGNYSGPFAENQTIEVSSRSIQLDAGGSTDDGGNEGLTFQWSVSGLEGADLSLEAGSATLLTIPDDQSGNVTVVLTVRDESGAEDQVQVTFQVDGASGAFAASISAPAAAEAGEEIVVEGDVAGGSESGEYRYVWTAVTGGGEPVDIYSTGPRARLLAPALQSLEPEIVTIGLTVYQDGVASKPAAAEIEVTGPSLQFSQLAVGLIDAEREFQTLVVLVNNTDVTAEGRITFINNDYGDAWSVRVNGEVRSELALNVGPGGAVKYVLSGDDVEVGWLDLESNVRLTGHLFYQVVERESRRTLREVPILPTSGRGFRTALDAGQNGNLALALVNLGDEEVRFHIGIQSTDGGAMESGEMVLGPRQHMARFLGEIFDGGEFAAAIPDSFEGGTLMIKVVGESGELAATIIKTDEGLPLSILPVGTW